MEIKGKVCASVSRPRGCGGRITVLEMITDAGADIISFNIPGQHIFRNGEKVSVEYESHSGVNWVSRYKIPSDKYACIVGNQ